MAGDEELVQWAKDQGATVGRAELHEFCCLGTSYEPAFSCDTQAACSSAHQPLWPFPTAAVNALHHLSMHIYQLP